MNLAWEKHGIIVHLRREDGRYLSKDDVKAVFLHLLEPDAYPPPAMVEFIPQEDETPITYYKR